MENQITTLDKAVKISIIAGALIVALSVAYYLVIFLPQKEQVRIEFEKQGLQVKADKEQAESDRLSKIKTANSRLLALCLSEADDQYWNYMELNGSGKRFDKNGVSASQTNWAVADKRKQQESENCFKKYPQN